MNHETWNLKHKRWSRVLSSACPVRFGHIAQLVRALHFHPVTNFGLVAQLVRAFDSHSKGQRFESSRAHVIFVTGQALQRSLVRVQMCPLPKSNGVKLERSIHIRKVRGSSPLGPTIVVTGRALQRRKAPYPPKSEAIGSRIAVL